MSAADQDRPQAGEGAVGSPAGSSAGPSAEPSLGPSAEPSATAAAPSTDPLDEPVVISSYLVNTRDGDVQKVADRVTLIGGVEAHQRFAGQFVITIEAASIDASIEAIKEVNATAGVINSVMVYANFEDDPLIQAQLEKNRASRKATSEQAEG